MAATTVSFNNFNQNTSEIARATSQGPVIITESGKPEYVLLRHEEYQRLKPKQPFVSLLDAVAMPEDDDIEFEPAVFKDKPSFDFD